MLIPTTHSFVHSFDLETLSNINDEQISVFAQIARQIMFLTATTPSSSFRFSLSHFVSLFSLLSLDEKYVVRDTTVDNQKLKKTMLETQGDFRYERYALWTQRICNSVNYGRVSREHRLRRNLANWIRAPR